MTTSSFPRIRRSINSNSPSQTKKMPSRVVIPSGSIFIILEALKDCRNKTAFNNSKTFEDAIIACGGIDKLSKSYYGSEK